MHLHFALLAVQEPATVNLSSVLLGGVIALFVAVAGPLFVQWRKQCSERKSLTAAIVSEIAAIVDIAERRQYVEGLRAFIAELRRSQLPPGSTPVYLFSVRRNPFMVFDANLERLGSLAAPLPRLIVKFYSQASAILEDIGDMREGLVKLPPPQAITRLERLLALFEDTLALGKKIMEAPE